MGKVGEPGCFLNLTKRKFFKTNSRFFYRNMKKNIKLFGGYTLFIYICRVLSVMDPYKVINLTIYLLDA